jgi:quercetin dioxygenase-like cupin family protein
MNPIIKSGTILACCASLFIISCNSGEKKVDEAKSMDSAASVKMEAEAKAKTDAAPVAPAIPDAITANPELYKVIKDTLGLKLIEATYRPGESSAMHTHTDYALYVSSGGTAEFTDKDGKKTVNDMKTGSYNIKAAETHSVKNTGKTTIKVIMLETSRKPGLVATDAAMDATKAASAFYKVKMDEMGFRILEGDYKPGQSSPKHGHPDLAAIFITGGTAEFTDKDGKKMTATTKSGDAGISAADVHSVKNVGKSAFRVLLIEVNRAR